MTVIENVLSEFFFLKKSATFSICSGLKYLLSLGFVSISSLYMPQEMLKAVHSNRIYSEKVYN